MTDRNIVQKLRAYSLKHKMLGFLSGVFLFLFTVSAGTTLQQSTINEDIQKLRLGLVAIFIGITQGYYLGRASKEGSGPIFSFLLGICISLTGLVLYRSKVSLITLTLFLGTVSVFLMYTSKIIESHERMEDWIEYCKTASWSGLIVILFIQFILPIILRLSNWLIGTPENIGELLDTWNSTNIVIGIVVLFVLIAGVIKYISRAISRK